MRLSSFMGIFFNIGFHHCLIFSTIISATDPVSVLTTFQGYQADENLYSLIFGESIMNDAIAIAFYNAIMKIS